MHIVIWIAMGMVVGFLSQLLLKADWRVGLNGSLALGVIGAVLASSALRSIGIGMPGTGLESLIIAFGGAATLLLWTRRLTMRKARVRG